MSDVFEVKLCRITQLVPLVYELWFKKTFKSEFHALRWALINNVIVTDIFKLTVFSLENQENYKLKGGIFIKNLNRVTE